MNKEFSNPLYVHFMAAAEKPQVTVRKDGVIQVPVNTGYRQFSEAVLPEVKTHDAVLVHVNGGVDKDARGMVNNMAVKLNGLVGAANGADHPVLTYNSPGQPFHWMNPSFKDKQDGHAYKPDDTVILDRYSSFPDNDAWQEHQDKIWSRMADMMPLSRKADKYSRNHAAQLMDPKRGLEQEDLKKFWSFKSGAAISPEILGDDMVGMPSIEGKYYDGFAYVKTGENGTTTRTDIEVRSLQTYGTTGIAIPVANINGHVAKHQIAADSNAYNMVLNFRAADGKTVGKAGLFDKKSRVYAFNFTDGTPTKLRTTAVDMNENITMTDAKGEFQVKPKQEIIDILKERGYELPGIIASAKPAVNGKYMWQSPGTMTGSKEVQDIVTPSNPGFIVAREPRNGKTDYSLLIAEGALKGHIVAKYIDVKDSEGKSVGDMIAGDKGIIVSQIPGVAEAFIEKVAVVYDKYDVSQTFVAMDADGRENMNVAKSIKKAQDILSEQSPTTVLCWNPDQKGLDDALLAVAQGKIAINDMELVTGMAEELFPVEQTNSMVPHKFTDKLEEPVQEPAKEEPVQEPVKEEPVQEPVKEEPVQDTVFESLDKKLQAKIEKWNAESLEMDPIITPGGYKSVYQYQQAVIRQENKNLNLSVKPVYQHRGDWGVLNLESDHVIEAAEKEQIREVLGTSGMTLIGDMKLTQQTLSMDVTMQQAKVADMKIEQ